MRRFYAVLAPHGSLVHRANTRTEGDKTWCGIRMRTSWKWWTALDRSMQRRTKALRCPRCEVA